MIQLNVKWELGSQAASSGETLVIDANYNNAHPIKTLSILAKQILLIKEAIVIYMVMTL